MQHQESKLREHANLGAAIQRLKALRFWKAVSFSRGHFYRIKDESIAHYMLWERLEICKKQFITAPFLIGNYFKPDCRRNLYGIRMMLKLIRKIFQ